MTDPVATDQEPGPEVVGIGRRGREAIIQLTVRTGAVRLITLIGTVILARLLLPADFGAFAVIAFLVGMLAPFGDLGLGAALIQQRDRPSEDDVATVFTTQQIAWIALVALAWLLAPLITLAGPDLPADAPNMIRVTALALFANQLRAVPTAMMSRVLRFGPLAAIEVVQQIAYVSVAVAVALAGGGVWSFLLGLAAQFSIGTLLTYVAWGRPPPIGVHRASFRRLFGFGMLYQSASILNLFREALVPVFGGLAGGVGGIGYLNFGQRLGRLVGSLDEIVGRVAFPTFSRLQGERERVSLAFLHVIESTALLMSAVLGWSIAVAPTLISVVFSSTWLPAAPVFQLTALAVLAAVPASFCRGLAFSVGRTRSVLLWSIVALGVTFVAFPLLLLGLGLAGGGLGFVIHAVLQLLGFVHATRDVIAFPWLRLARIYALGALAGVAAAASLLAVDGLPGLVVSGVAFVLAFGVLLLVFERDQVRRSWRLVRGRTTLEAV